MSAVFSPLDDDFSPDRQVAQLRVPPHSIEANPACWAGCCWTTAPGTGWVTCWSDSDFYRYEHKLIYAAIGALINATKPADVITVYEHLQNQGKAEEVAAWPT
jgi:replicative DNA helicase